MDGLSFELKIVEGQRSHIVVVDTDSTAALVAHILLDRRSFPATESRIVTKAGPVVIVSVPQRKTHRCGVVPAKANNRLPVVIAGVDTSFDAQPLSLVDHSPDEGLVGDFTGRPSTIFDIVPIHVESGPGAVQEVNSGAHLTGRIAAAYTWEDIGSYRLYSCCSCRLDCRRCCFIGGTI